jgi:hypothetical protein
MALAFGLCRLELIWLLDFLDAVSKGCNLSCSDPDSGPCVSLEKCRCTRTEDEEDCDIGQSS